MEAGRRQRRNAKKNKAKKRKTEDGQSVDGVDDEIKSIRRA
jgi:hypothetical protein